jgi:uncharacterized membrane protein YkoI
MSVALTAFVLVFLGAALGIGRWAQASPANPTLDPQLLAQLQAREATYQAMIAQANSQLQATNPPAAPTIAPTPTQEPTVVYPISPDMAAYLALSATPGSYLVRAPDLISFQGVVAYEVTLNSGRVYVDANDGQILFNGAAITSAGGSGSSAGGGENDEGD